MNTLFAALSGVLIAGAIYLILSRHAFRILLGLMLLANGANLVVLVAGRLRRASTPFIPKHLNGLPAIELTNPLPQAVILTAIVIGLGFFVFLLALLLPVGRQFKTLDVNRIRAVEPPRPAPEEDGSAR